MITIIVLWIEISSLQYDCGFINWLKIHFMEFKQYKIVFIVYVLFDGIWYYLP
jgi:hypothetical protein